MMLVAIAWMYVVLMMALVEALSPLGTVLGAFFTFVLYGALPLGIVLYVMAAPARQRLRKKALSSAADAPDGGNVAAAAAVTPERKEP